MKLLLDETEIRNKVSILAERIARDYRDKPLTVLGILTGNMILISDLIRRIDVPLRLGLIQASRYRGKTATPAELIVHESLVPDIAGRDVLLVDDIFDTGITLREIAKKVTFRNPNSLKTLVLLWKEGRSRVEIEPDYFGFRIPDSFVVGYGLDYNDEYRHLPYIAALEENEM